MSEAKRVVASLPVRAWASMDGYSRTAFGPAWADVNHNGCDTRNDILTRDLTDRTYEDYSPTCLVESGLLHDPYTGQTIHFQRGYTTSWQVQIDHMVPLADAWKTGAQDWSAERRELFANDPRELIAVDARSNDQKGDSNTADWIPPNHVFDCQYVADQVMIKHAWDLWVTSWEKAAMIRILKVCS